MSKVTWEDVYKDFKSRFPRLREHAKYWKAVDYLTIKIYCRGGLVVKYNYETKSCTVVEIEE